MTQTSLGTILLVCTSHAKLGETGNETGFWMEEMAAPYFAFIDAGYHVVIASPMGGNPPVDPGSLSQDMRGPSVKRFEADAAAVTTLSASIPLEEVTEMHRYAGIFLVGGHGAMWDFPRNTKLGQLLMQAVSQNKIIGAVCHGVAGLLAKGVPSALKAKTVAGFSNQEETAVGLTDVVPFLLETELGEAGFNYSNGSVFAPHVETDGNLVTGQNPASSQAVADAMLQALIGAKME